MPSFDPVIVNTPKGKLDVSEILGLLPELMALAMVAKEQVEGLPDKPTFEQFGQVSAALSPKLGALIDRIKAEAAD